jgi:putative addiction module killer protein
MNTFERSEEFDAWLTALKDNVGRARIVHRIRSAEHGNFGDCEPVGEGVSEMRIHVGPGYRVYFTRRAAVIYLLLVAGDKSQHVILAKARIQFVRPCEASNKILRIGLRTGFWLSPERQCSCFPL